MADGYVLIEINPKGEGRVKELTYFDFRFEEGNFNDAEGLEQLLDQMPKELTDVLVLISFKYSCNCSQGWQGEVDCEELYEIFSYTVVKVGYKEFYRSMVTEETDLYQKKLKFENQMDEKLYSEAIAEWEEFYEEDFVPFETKVVHNIGDIWKINKNA